MKYTLEQQLEITRVLLKLDPGMTYSQMAEECNRLFNRQVKITAQLVRAMLIRFKNFAVARCTKLLLAGECNKARMYLRWIEEIFPTRQRGRRRVH